MAEFKDIFRQRRKSMGLTLEDIAQELKLNKTTISRYEKGTISNIPPETIEKLAIVLRCTPAYLMGWIDDPDLTVGFDNIFDIEKKKIPLLGTISAGAPIYAHENFDGYIETGVDLNADFCLKVKGDSMINARIYDGDIVFIRRQNDVYDGEIAAVLIDDEVTLKRVYKFPDMIQLRAENPAYSPMNFSSSDFKNIMILGKAVAFQAPVK